MGGLCSGPAADKTNDAEIETRTAGGDVETSEQQKVKYNKSNSSQSAASENQSARSLGRQKSLVTEEWHTVFQAIRSIPADVKAMQQMRGQGAASRAIAYQPGGYAELTEFMESDEPCGRKTFYAGESVEPWHAMDFWNVHGSKVYTYTGLNAQGDPDDAITACGVVMLDKYAIQERPGDPASPLTWWPYEAFYVVPKGIDFAKCKAVGSAGKDAWTTHPDETKTICQGLDALATVAEEQGKERLFITGDCGYYSLALPAYVQVLMKMGWVRKGDACMNAPCFRVRDRIDVYLCLGASQMIASSDPKESIVGKAHKCSIIYATADLRGWYAGDVFKKLDGEYPPFETMIEIMRFNEGIPWGMMLAWHPHKENELWNAIGDQLKEAEHGNTAFVLGMFAAWASRPEACKGDDQGPLRRAHYADMPENAHRLLTEAIHDRRPFHEFVKPAILAVFVKSVKAGISRRKWSGNTDKLVFNDLTPAEVMTSFIILMGRESDEFKTGGSFADALSDRITDTIEVLLGFDEGEDKLPGHEAAVTCAGRYEKWYCKLNMRLNKTIIKDAAAPPGVGHAVDGQHVFLLDALYIPGFGEQVAQGLTVWSYTTFFCWLSRIYGGFAQLVQEETKRPIIYHQECTELFQFTNFIQQFGMPCIDNINYMVLASKSTSQPLEFQRWSYDLTPAALLFAEGKWYRSPAVLLRTPDHLAVTYSLFKQFIYPETLYSNEDRMWDSIEKGAVRFGKDVVGSGPGEALYVESTLLVENYNSKPRQFNRDAEITGSVQYGA